MELKPIVLPNDFTDIGIFLTFSCQLRCGYCINFHGDELSKNRRMSKDDWIRGLNRIVTRPNLPLTVAGGEPTVYKYFYEVIAGIEKRIPIDLLTNLEIDIDRFCSNVPPDRMYREDGYPSIRVSYHHGQSKFDELLSNVALLRRRGYSIAVWEVAHPEYLEDVLMRQSEAVARGVDYRTKEFLGPWKGHNYGTFRYPDAVNSDRLRNCECKISELLVAPDGKIFRCNSDLYADRSPIGHILDEEPPILGAWRPCSVYGKCHSCDIRIQTKPYKPVGHSGVEIRNIGEPYAPNVQIIDVINTYGKR